MSLPFLHKAMSSVNCVRSVTSGSLKVTRSRLSSDVPESKVRVSCETSRPFSAEKFPGELQFAGRELVVVDCQPAVELRAAVIADFLLRHVEGDGLHSQAQEIHARTRP